MVYIRERINYYINVGEVCSDNNECYSNNCDKLSIFHNQKTCIGRGYIELCDTTEKYCNFFYV
jgi:hypothetical protein